MEKKLTVLVTTFVGLLLTFACLFLGSSLQGGPLWAGWVSGLLFSVLLLAPAGLALVRPNLAVQWFVSILYMTTQRRKIHPFDYAETPRYTGWEEMNDLQRSALRFVSFLLFVFGMLVLGLTVYSILKNS